MVHQEIRQKFLEFFKAPGHIIVPSSSLLPDDPSVLFTTAGMQQFKKYYTGDADALNDFGSLNVASIQKCLRTSDIDQVGDESHLTFFEMLGNFSFGGYFKKEAIKYAYEFITKEMGLKIDYVSVFCGEDGISADTKSEEIWEAVDPNIKIVRSGRADNFWGPTGDEGPCGPTTEIYVNGIEIWNIVFNEYYKYPDSRLEKLKVPGVDTGMGLDRLAMVSQNMPTVFETDLFAPIINLIPESLEIRTRRIISDHSRAIVFLLAEGVVPSNKEQGYVLRKIIRRTLVHERLNEQKDSAFNMVEILEKVVSIYKPFYNNLDIPLVVEAFAQEEAKCLKALDEGVKELKKLLTLDAVAAFKLYESYGLPYEVIKEVGGDKTKDLTRQAFDEKFREHQEKSRTASVGMFKGGLTGSSRIMTRYHTATHLLNAALRRVLGESVVQKGSNITEERTRFDFTFDRKLTFEELKQVEDMVNQKIDEDLPMQKVVMPKSEAEKTGALFFFKEKYPDPVNVYFVGKSLDSAFSKEFCGGPHVAHTGEIGKFKIIKEEAASAGVRRIRATVE